MTLTEILDAVATQTKRPDLEEQILLDVQEATLFCHSFDFFRRDLIEVPLSYQPLGLQSGQILLNDSLLPAFRKISYWRKWDPVGLVAGNYLSPCEPDVMLNEYRQKKTDVYYVSGRVVNWISSSVDLAHIIGYWRLPDISRSKYNSWIADVQPFAIINRAASKIFRTIGMQEEGNAARADASEMLHILQINDIESEGR